MIPGDQSHEPNREDLFDLVTKTLHPEQVLWLAVIRRAVNDALSKATACAGQRFKQDAVVYERRGKSYIIQETGSFKYACEAVGISHDAIKEIVIRKIRAEEKRKAGSREEPALLKGDRKGKKGKRAVVRSDDAREIKTCQAKFIPACSSADRRPAPSCQAVLEGLSLD
jgi:hypothetical protein